MGFGAILECKFQMISKWTSFGCTLEDPGVMEGEGEEVVNGNQAMLRKGCHMFHWDTTVTPKKNPMHNEPRFCTGSQNRCKWEMIVGLILCE